MTTEELAKSMAELTCRLSKVCLEKDAYLAAMFNLTPAEFRCLKLFSNTSQLSIKSLGKELNLSPGRITHILTSLENKGFVTRHLDPSDKRNVLVDITAKCKPFIKNLDECHLQVHKEILKIIDPCERDCIIGAMEAVVSAIGQWSESKGRTN
ncbi:MAG: MarR family transcriptional regulator [Bacteroidetes bacterium]|nr:MarR family transcriptional regulator [Bacteroidota bacterium]